MTHLILAPLGTLKRRSKKYRDLHAALHCEVYGRRPWWVY